MDGATDRQPFECARLRTSSLLDAYLDGELPLREAVDVRGHLDRCPECAQAAERERSCRLRLLRERSRVTPPADLLDRVRRALRRLEWHERLRGSAPRLALAVLSSAALVALLAWGLRTAPLEADLVRDLVVNHRLYSSLDAPVEFGSASRPEVAGWIRRQLALSVPVPDFSREGLRLLGARLGTHGEHSMAHLLYEKGRALLSLYVLPASGVSLPRRGWSALDGHAVLIRESAEYRVLLGRSGRFVFALVSTLDREALVECARTFLREGGQRLAVVEAAPAGISKRKPVLTVSESRPDQHLQ